MSYLTQLANEQQANLDSNQQEIVDCKAQISLCSHKVEILQASLGPMPGLEHPGGTFHT